jgi:SAM-dependent methyltransferase
MVNYQFCADFAARHCSPGAKILDYGCGAGQIVVLMRSAGLDAFGCEMFYAGGDLRDRVPPELLDSVIRPMSDDRIPFPDGTFDFVLSNQVMEHVENLDAVLSEMSRVLKPGGTVLSVFPHRETWREGHSGIPLLHWFPKGRARVYYAATLSRLGLGYFKNNKSHMQWAADFCDWIDRWCHYRSYREIAATFARYFGPPRHIEDEWFAARVGQRAAFVPRPLQKLIAAKWGNIAFLCEKPRALR